jgi:fluoride exporter
MRGQPSRRPHLDARELAAIFAGGALGALARMGLIETLPHAQGTWPRATLGANLAGALLLGWVVTRLPSDSGRRPFLGAGACGALTTFSTLQLELLQLLDEGAWALATAYAAVSLAGGLAAVRLGIALAQRGRIAA